MTLHHKKKNKLVGEDIKKGNSCSLLEGMYIGTATMENSAKFPQKLKIDY